MIRQEKGDPEEASVKETDNRQTGAGEDHQEEDTEMDQEEITEALLEEAIEAPQEVATEAPQEEETATVDVAEAVVAVMAAEANTRERVVSRGSAEVRKHSTTRLIKNAPVDTRMMAYREASGSKTMMTAT